MKDVLAGLKTTIDESGAEITSTELPALRTRAVHLRQLFQNLISNAIKYTRERKPVINISAEAVGSEWVLPSRITEWASAWSIKTKSLGSSGVFTTRGNIPGRGLDWHYATTSSVFMGVEYGSSLRPARGQRSIFHCLGERLCEKKRRRFFLRRTIRLMFFWSSCFAIAQRNGQPSRRRGRGHRHVLYRGRRVE